MNATEIAARLSKGQRSTIVNMDDEPQVLGCSEPTAIRLAQGKAKRPPLTQRHPPTHEGDMGQWPRFSLTTAGLAVKAAIQGNAHAPQ